MILRHRSGTPAIIAAMVGGVALALIGCADIPIPSAPADSQQGGGGVGPGPAEAQLSGDITGARFLSADTVYTLVGQVQVLDGAVLSIEPGTTILGSTEVRPTLLVVQRGGRIEAEGTRTDPIVFTSAAPEGQRQRGDWGGVLINGRAPCNFPGGECVAEGGFGSFGGDQPDDDSGILRFVRIEFAGFEVSFGNEANALTLNGVGRGTEIDHVQTHFGLDDGFEWFGGTVDVKHALATGISDDSFDYSTGWTGRGQFWIAQHDPADADNGFEVDNNEEDFQATPVTNPKVFNVTLVGGGEGSVAGESETGMLLRRGTGGIIRNAIVIGFQSEGLDLDSDVTFQRASSGELDVTHSIFFGNAVNFLDEEGDPFSVEDWALDPARANRVVDPGLSAPFDRANPDWRPMAGSAALSGFATPPSDGFFDPVDFIGAVSPDGVAWTDGWTTTALN